jgi:hypothetical protein
MQRFVLLRKKIQHNHLANLALALLEVALKISPQWLSSNIATWTCLLRKDRNEYMRDSGKKTDAYDFSDSKSRGAVDTKHSATSSTITHSTLSIPDAGQGKPSLLYRVRFPRSEGRSKEKEKDEEALTEFS